MRGIQGQVAVRVALGPHEGDGGPEAEVGPVIDTRGFGSMVWQIMFHPNAGREVTEIECSALTVQESESASMSSPATIWTCGTDKTIRGDTSTLPNYTDPNFPSSEGQQPRVLVIPDLSRRKRYMRASIIVGATTSYYGFVYLLDPVESLTTEAQIAGGVEDSQVVYIGGAL